MELAIEAQFPDVDVVTMEKSSIPDIQSYVSQPGVQDDLEDIIFTGYIKDVELSNNIFMILARRILPHFTINLC